MEMSKTYLTPEDTHPSVVLIGVKSKEKLLNVLEYIRSKNIQVKEFHEPLFDNEITAISTVPVSQQDREIFKKYQLYKEKV